MRRATPAEDVEAFLQAYPQGRFAVAARLRLQQLRRQPGGTQVAVGTYPPRPESPPEWPPTLRNSIGMEFVRIPAGEFQMGSNDREAEKDEQPVHRVRISQSYYLGTYEVTQGQWRAVMGNNPSYFGQCGAAAGTTTPATAGRRIATTTPPAIATTISAFAC